MTASKGKTDAMAQARNLAAAIIAAAGISAGGWLSFPIPGTDIPQTGQTVAVLLVGALLGPLRGSMAVVLYLLAGLVGLPVFSDGGAGWTVLSGPSAGYFVGFLLAAAAVGALLKPARHADFLLTSAVFVAGHGLILLAGWMWMSLESGPGQAFSRSVTPFLYGSLVKSLLAAALLCANWYLVPARFSQFR